MRSIVIAVLLFGNCFSLFAENIVLSKLDPAFATAREKAFIPWGEQKESTVAWNELSSMNIPIYYERKEGRLMRNIYVPREDTAYWVLNGLTKTDLLAVTKEKAPLGLELVSASQYKDEDGNNHYWALWVAHDKVDYVKSRMTGLGITPARIEPGFWDRWSLSWGH